MTPVLLAFVTGILCTLIAQRLAALVRQRVARQGDGLRSADPARQELATETQPARDSNPTLGRRSAVTRVKRLWFVLHSRLGLGKRRAAVPTVPEFPPAVMRSPVLTDDPARAVVANPENVSRRTVLPAVLEPALKGPLAWVAEEANAQPVEILIGHAGENDLRTSMAIELGVIKDHNGRWLLSPFDLGGADVRLGHVRVRLSALPIVGPAARLTASLGDDTVEVDLSRFATPGVPLHGEVRDVRPEGKDSTWSSRDGIVHCYLVGGISTPTSTIRRVLAEFEGMRLLWTGDAEVYCRALLLDLRSALGLWPTVPEGTRIGVSVAGPGPLGPVWSAAGDVSVNARPGGIDVLSDGEALGVVELDDHDDLDDRTGFDAEARNPVGRQPPLEI